MKHDAWIRTEMLLGTEAVQTLKNKRVAVFGLGGVGGHCVEALARSGIGQLDLIDNDTISESNINRQLIATYDTIGQYKTEAFKKRIESIAPDCHVVLHTCFYLPQRRQDFPFEQYDYIVDCIDTITAKIDLAVLAEEMNIPMISSMGTGNKLNPYMFEVSDIYKTSVCPLAKVMRRELKKRNVSGLKVIYSREEPMTPLPLEEADNRRMTPGSVAFVPAVAGLMIAREVVLDLIK